MDSPDTTKSVPVNRGTRPEFYDIAMGMMDFISHINLLTRRLWELETRIEKLERKK